MTARGVQLPVERAAAAAEARIGLGRAARSGLPPRALDDVEDAENLGAIAHHVPVAGLPPAKRTVAIHDEGGAVGHVPVLVEDAVGADGFAVDVAQQRERKARGLGEGLVAEETVPADREEGCSPVLQGAGDLSQAGELGRSDPAPVVAVEGDDDVGLALVLLERDGPAEG